MKLSLFAKLALVASVHAEINLMEGISDLQVNNNVSDSIVDRLYPGWRTDAVQTAGRMNVAEDGSGSFNFVAGGITVAGYYGAIGYNQIAAARAACISRGTAEDGTFACLNQAAAATCLHGAITLAGGFAYDQVIELLTSGGDGQEGKDKSKGRKRACAISDTYSTDYSFNKPGFEIKHTGHGACTLFPRGQSPYINNIWSQMGEIAFAEHSALYIQWTMYDKASGNVYIRWHSEIDTAATDICPLYVSGSGCKF